MSAAPERVNEGELAFFFQTNEPIPARPLLDFLYEVERLARTRRHLGPDTVAEIVEVLTGTKLVRMTFDRKMNMASVALAAGSFAVAVVALANDLTGKIQQPSGRLAETVARMCLDHGVAECVITSSEGQVRIGRDALPAVTALRDRRERTDRLDAEPRPPAIAQRLRTPQRDEAVRALPEGMFEDEREVRDGRVYTLVGRLRRSSGRSREWQFTSQAGTDYIARGVDNARASLPPDAMIVIRAEVAGKEGGVTVLSIKDVFEPDEP